jgi:hypothetical protein
MRCLTAISVVDARVRVLVLGSKEIEEESFE